MKLIAKRFVRFYLKYYILIIMVMASAIAMIYMPCLYRSSVEYGESEYIKELTHGCDVMLTGNTDVISEILSGMDDADCITCTSDSDNVYVTITDKDRTEYISLEISYIIGQSNENIEVNSFYDIQTTEPELIFTLLIVRIIFTVFGIVSVEISFRLFNESRRNDLNMLFRIGMSKSDFEKLFISEIAALMTVSVFTAIILCDIIMKISIRSFYSFSEVFVRIIYHKDARLYADIISASVVIAVISYVLVMRSISKEQSEYIYHFRGNIKSDETLSTLLPRVFSYRDLRYSVPVILFSAAAIFVSFSVTCMSGLLYTDYDGADIIVSADRETVITNLVYVEKVFSQIEEMANCEIYDDRSYTGFIVPTDRSSEYSTYEIVNNKQCVLACIVPISDESIAPDFMHAYVASESDMYLFFDESVELTKISDDTCCFSIILDGKYNNAAETSVFTLYVSESTFESVCGFSPVIVSKYLKFSTEDEYQYAREAILSAITDDFEITDVRKNISEQNRNARVIETILLFMTGMFTAGVSAVVFSLSMTEKNANEQSDRILLRLGCSPVHLKNQHIMACVLKYIVSAASGLIPSLITVTIAAHFNGGLHISLVSAVFLILGILWLFIPCSCMYYIKEKAE